MSRITPAMAKNAIKRSLYSILDPELTESEKVAIWKHFSSKCAYCGRALERTRRDGHIDHLIPITKGGTNHISNRVLSCPKCNGDEKREELWESFLNQKISDPNVREEHRKKIKDWIEINPNRIMMIDKIVLQQNIDEVCQAFDKAVANLRGKYIKPPYYIKCEHGGEHIGVLAYHHKEGGVCFLDTGWHHVGGSPFHILKGSFVAKETPEGVVYEAENGDFIRKLTRNDRLWSGWQNWQDYLNSPDGIETTEDKAVKGCQSNGALIERPL